MRITHFKVTAPSFVRVGEIVVNLQRGTIHGGPLNRLTCEI